MCTSDMQEPHEKLLCAFCAILREPLRWAFSTQQALTSIFLPFLTSTMRVILMIDTPP